MPTVESLSSPLAADLRNGHLVTPLTNTILTKTILPGVAIENPDQRSLRADPCRPTEAEVSEGTNRDADRPQRSLVESVDGATRRHMEVEAAHYAAKVKDTIPLRDLKRIPPDMRVEPQPDELYRTPDWLRKTATATQVSELTDLLDELRALNQEFSGELVTEVAVYFTATRLDVDLTNRFQRWCDGYVRQRADPANLNPRVGPHPFCLHRKVYGEVVKILSPIANLKHTLNIRVLAEPIRFADWLLYDLLWKGDLRLEGDGWCSFPANLPGGRATGELLIDYAIERDFLVDGMQSFLASVKTWSAERGQHATRSETELHSGLVSLATDIQVMRPLLVRNFNSTKTILRLADELWVAWDWQVRNGIGYIITGRSETELLTFLATRQVRKYYVVRHDGLLAYGETAWRTSDGLTEGDPLVANFSLSRIIHMR